MINEEGRRESWGGEETLFFSFPSLHALELLTRYQLPLAPFYFLPVFQLQLLPRAKKIYRKACGGGSYNGIIIQADIDNRDRLDYRSGLVWSTLGGARAPFSTVKHDDAKDRKRKCCL